MIEIVSINATSVNVSLAQPQLSFTPVGYTVTLIRVTGSNQRICSDAALNTSQSVVSTSTLTFSVQEFSNYSISVAARFDEFGTSLTEVSNTMSFATPSAGLCLSAYMCICVC